MTAFATVPDLEARWRTLTDAESATAETLLEDASTRLRLTYPDLNARIAADTSGVLAEGAKIVVCGVVKRAMQTPDGPPVSSQQTTAGPFSQQFSYSNPTGDLYLTKQEKLLLGYGSQRAFSIDLAGS
jgi:hypothetical protein